MNESKVDVLFEAIRKVKQYKLEDYFAISSKRLIGYSICVLSSFADKVSAM